jgi:signal transduction histidine kinase
MTTAKDSGLGQEQARPVLGAGAGQACAHAGSGYGQDRTGWDIADAAKVPLFVVDRDGKLTWANRALVTRAGQPLSSLIGRTCRELFGQHLGDRESEVTIPLLNGVFLHAPAPLTSGNGYSGWTAHSLTDVSESVRLKSMVLQSEKLAALGMVVAGVTHEINSPLTTIMGMTELVLRQTDLPQPVRDKLERVLKESIRCGNLTRNLLDFARAHESEWKPVDVGKVLRETLQLLAYRLRSTGVRIVESLAPDLPSVYGEPHQLQQVFLNLVVNAHQAMEGRPEKVLTLGARVLEAGESFGVTTGRAVQVTVQDTGTGIPAAVLAKIFDPFFTTKEVGQGTGLGLSVSRSIIMAHRGRLYAESEEGAGACFFVELPVPEGAS